MTANVLVDGSLPSAAAANNVGIKPTPDPPNGHRLSSLPRSASHVQIPTTTVPYTTPESNGIKRTFSENVLANPKGNDFRQSFSKQASESVENINEKLNGKSLLRRRSTRSLVSPKITVSKFALGPRRGTGDLAYESRKDDSKETLDPDIKRRTVSASLTSFARKSWISASRSPSPNKRDALPNGVLVKDPGSNNARPPSRSSALTRIDSKNVATNGQVGTPTKRTSTISKRSRRPLSAILGKSSTETDAPSVPSIPISYSTDRLPSLNYNPFSSEQPHTMPKSRSSERLQGMGMESPRRKDELWGAFRALDGDFQK